MADIDVVKRGSSSWMWILVVLALMVLLWIVWGSMRTDDTSGPTGELREHNARIALQASGTSPMS